MDKEPKSKLGRVTTLACFDLLISSVQYTLTKHEKTLDQKEKQTFLW